MEELWQWGAKETATRIAAGEVSCVDVVDAHLERMASTNPAVNAVTVDLSEQARAAAQAADTLFAGGADVGAMHGVPITIKENVDVAGQATPNGLPALADTIAEEDSPQVASLRQAGAIIIGRTNTPEFSFRWHTDNPLRGATLNPWDEARTPGGSSGGAASSVALGIGCVAHGNDLGGSLRYPAYCCGLTTVRPTLGRVPAYNASAPAERSPSLQLMSVQGPIAREVADVRLALEVMAQSSWQDPWHVPVPVAGPISAGPLRVALSYGPVATPPQPAVVAAVDAAGAALADAGYDVVAGRPPNLEEMAARWQALLSAEVRAGMIDLVREMGSEDVNHAIDWMLATAPELDLAGYITMLADRTRHLRAWQHFMEDTPLVLSPVSQEVAILAGDDVRSKQRMVEILSAQTMLVVANYLGFPAAAVPTGLTDGVPVGVQILGPRFREDLCLDAAEVIEGSTGILATKLWAAG